MKNFKQIFGLLFLVFTFILFGIPATAQSLEQAIDQLIRTELGDENGPGGVFMVAKNGKPIYQKAFGLANLELGTLLKTESVFQIGSMTKQFTAISILMLEQEGKLNTQDFISEYIPDFPNGDKITIHHLLTHTSGIKDFTRMKSLNEISKNQMSPKDLVNFFKDEPVDFAPGERFEYNNSGYLVLGYLIELASGESYEEFIETHIFKKIGMEHSYYASDRQLIPDRAYGYSLKETGYVNRTVINFSIPYASGALMSTSEDLLKWQNALNQNTLLKKEYDAQVFERKLLSNGEEISYGYGWHLRDMAGSPSREHGGNIFGFKSMGVYLPNEDIYVVGLTNCDCNSPTQLSLNIAKLVLESISDL